MGGRNMRDKIVTFFILFCTYQLHISSATVLTKSTECPSVPVRMSLDIANSAMEKAKQMGKNFNVAVLDPAAHMVAFNRMDGAALGSIDVSIKKAKTSSLFGIESSLLGVISQPGASAYGAEQTNGG